MHMVRRNAAWLPSSVYPDMYRLLAGGRLSSVSVLTSICLQERDTLQLQEGLAAPRAMKLEAVDLHSSSSLPPLCSVMSDRRAAVHTTSLLQIGITIFPCVVDH